MAGTVHTKAYQTLLGILVELRKQRGLSQAALAKELKKPPSFVGKYELGERRLDVVETLVILHVLDANPHETFSQLEADLPNILSD